MPLRPCERLPGGLEECLGHTNHSHGKNLIIMDNAITEVPNGQRALVGQRLNDLLIARHIERYYWSRGNWHVVLPKGQFLVIPDAEIGPWLSGFRCGLRAKGLT